MLERVSWAHHLVVGGAVAGCSVLALVGVLGEPNRPERFEAKQVTVSPAGGDALRIREVIDQDFGSSQRRGHERFIPVDFGVPTDVTAQSATAPDAVSTTLMGGELRIRIGDPDVTINGQHRYELGFTLPEARLSSGELALDIIGTDETIETDRFEVVVAGFVLREPRCNVGRIGASGGCSLSRDGDVYRTVIEPLAPGEGITIGGTIEGIVAFELPDPPPLPERRSTPDRWPLALGLLPVGFGTAAAVYRQSSRRGRNEVFAGGAADAAFGTLPPPGVETVPVTGDVAVDAAATTLVSDRRLGDLATIEFAPPQGLEPWEGAVLLSERIDDSSVSAWFSGLAGSEAIVLETSGTALTMSWGPRRSDVDPATERVLGQVLKNNKPVKLSGYNEKFATAWSAVRTLQDERIRSSGWWKHQPPQSGLGVGCSAWVIVLALVIVVFWAGSLTLALLGLLSNPFLAVAFCVGVTVVVARIAYSSLRPARSAPGSALALRTESFRRFLAASEGQHVQWAWERGVLREYSAWAVALGAAEAWSRALEASNVPPAATATSSPLLVHTMRSALSSATTPPSSSDSGGSSGGFSGGSVGGGGGGGRSGSW